MSFLHIVLRQMRQRGLATALTILTVALGVALAVAVLVVRRGAGALFGQGDFGYDVIVGVKGSPIQLVVNTVYHMDRSPGNLPYDFYEKLLRDPLYRPQVRLAVPYVVGDSYRGHRIVGTLPKLFGVDDAGAPLPPDRVLEYRPSRRYELAAGRVFAADKFEAVVGSNIAAETGLKLGDQFQATHGLPAPGETPDIHKPKWTVVGVLAPTHTAADHVIFIPLLSFYTIAEHDVGLVAQSALREGRSPAEAIAELQQSAPPAPPPGEAAPGHEEEEEEEHFTLDAEGRIRLDLPQEVWAVSAILVQARSQPLALSLMYNINNGPDAMAVSPALVMREFAQRFLAGPSLVLLALAGLVTVVAAAGILIGIYNAVAARAGEIAVLRALGATRATVLALYCAEAALVGAAGATAGLVGGHLLAGAASAFLANTVGERIAWLSPAPVEWAYLLLVVALSALAGLAPALKAYRTPVAENLVPA